MSNKYTLINKNVRNVLSASLVAGAITFALGTGHTYANETTTTQDNPEQIQEVNQQTENHTVETTVTEAVVDESTSEEGALRKHQ